jgi:hypothetical protein
MGFQRLLRFVRSIQFVLYFFAFSVLLTFIFVLYQPTPGPGLIQKLGWQSWESVSVPPDIGQPNQKPSTDTTSPDGSLPDVDWWNVTDSLDDQADGISLPLDIWAPLLPHSTGRTCLALPCHDMMNSSCHSLRARHHAVHV